MVTPPVCFTVNLEEASSAGCAECTPTPPTPPPFSVTRAIDLLEIYRTVRTTQLKLNYFELTSANEVKCKLCENTFFLSPALGWGVGAANNRLIFARAVRFSNLIMVSFWHPYSSSVHLPFCLLFAMLNRFETKSNVA